MPHASSGIFLAPFPSGVDPEAVVYVAEMGGVLSVADVRMILFIRSATALVTDFLLVSPDGIEPSFFRIDLEDNDQYWYMEGPSLFMQQFNVRLSGHVAVRTGC
ncbi:MAG: hypothetical protein ABF806_09015 [Bifidobacterium psychraerophilum]|uniref:hypothetical protein n=1 Tax=Bifidobacterium psychraerophilum TaxID=218140 RepID=UPI0039E7BB7F